MLISKLLHFLFAIKQESFSPNTDNFLAFFVVFELGKILESAMDK